MLIILPGVILWTVRLHEKGGKQPAMPGHHALAEAMRLYRRLQHRQGPQVLAVPGLLVATTTAPCLTGPWAS